MMSTIVPSYLSFACESMFLVQCWGEGRGETLAARQGTVIGSCHFSAIRTIVASRKWVSDMDIRATALKNALQEGGSRRLTTGNGKFSPNLEVETYLMNEY